MSSAPPRASPLIIYSTVMLIVVAIVGAAYGFLVVREQRKADQARALADKLSYEVHRGRQYVDTHRGVSEQKRTVEETAAQVNEAIPKGPVDITVGSYLDKQAQAAHIEDFKWSFKGGIKPPSPGKDDSDRLSVDPGQLRSSVVDIHFTGRYKSVLEFIRALSPEEGEAPWPIEIVSLKIERNPMDAKSYDVAVSMTARYLYQ